VKRHEKSGSSKTDQQAQQEKVWNKSLIKPVCGFRRPCANVHALRISRFTSLESLMPTHLVRSKRSPLTVEFLEDRNLLSVSSYLPINLVSNQAGVARLQDTNLVNAWGLAISPNGGAFWVADNGADVATLYSGDVNGSAVHTVPLVVSIPNGAPTGQVFNANSNDFIVNDGNGNSGHAVFIFASESGTISGWSPAVPPPAPSTSAQIGVTIDGAVFKGLALANNGGANFLYATDFHNNAIDVFDNTFTQVTPAGTFSDPNLPAGYAPFGIQNIGGTLYVSYALQDAAAHDDVKGPGHGFIDAYDTDGNLLRRVASQGTLNSPWGMVQAPANFGHFSNDLLVGNFGDGRINAFDPDSGAFLGQLQLGARTPVHIPGLWGLAFGNGISAGNTNTLYFTAGPDDESNGLFGKIVAVNNVNDQVRAHLDDFDRVHHSDLVSAELEVLNRSRTTIPGPITVVITNIPTGVAVQNATGQTPTGGVIVTISSSDLARHRELHTDLLFSNPNRVSLRHLHIEIISGSF
jgi:uncharacterized protein (TIGR03118 family)